MCSEGSFHVFVSVSVKLHLTFGASVCCENAATYSVVKKFVAFSLKLLHYQDRALPPLDGHTCGWPFL